METSLFLADQTVAQILKERPQSAHVFINMKTDCVGCYMMKFCTLQDVSENYSIDLDELIEKFQTDISIRHGSKE
jgi:hybrid cluster-associated redox disulfide protein